MLPEALPPEEWMRFARSDLSVAERRLGPDVVAETLCFLAQQAAEKALKAVLRSYETAFPRTHNLRALLELLPAEVSVPVDISDAAGLTDYAVAARYPGSEEPIGQDEYREAVRLAHAVVAWAESVLAGPAP
jgi:HEPN domain-containing protein